MATVWGNTHPKRLSTRSEHTARGGDKVYCPVLFVKLVVRVQRLHPHGRLHDTHRKAILLKEVPEILECGPRVEITAAELKLNQLDQPLFHRLRATLKNV